MTGIILAAGIGSRLNKGLDESIIKPLIKVGKKCLIEYSLDNICSCYIKSAIIVVNEENGDIYSYTKDDYNGVEIKYAVQNEPKGLMNAVKSAADIIDDDILIQLSDEIFINPVAKECVDYFYNSGADFIVTYTHEKSAEKIKSNFSVDIDDNGNVIKCVEKSPIIINDLKGTGFCVFSKECVRAFKENYDEDKNFPNELCDYINFLIESGKCGKAFCIADTEININTVKDLEYAQSCVVSEE